MLKLVIFSGRPSPKHIRQHYLRRGLRIVGQRVGKRWALPGELEDGATEPRPCGGDDAA